MDNRNVLEVLGFIIDSYEKKHNIKTTEIAEICSVGRSTLFRIKSGNYDFNITYNLINKILDGLGYTYSDFNKMLEANAPNLLPIEDDGFIRIHKDSRIYDLVKDAVKLNDEDLDLVHSFIKKMM